MRVSLQGLKVLRVLLDAPQRIAGADIMRTVAIRGGGTIKAGTIYPLLIAFEKAGVLDFEWEVDAPRDLGRPRRRLYRLTPHGRQLAARELQDAVRALGAER